MRTSSPSTIWMRRRSSRTMSVKVTSVVRSGAMRPDAGSIASLLVGDRRHSSRARLVLAVTRKVTARTVENPTGQDGVAATLTTSRHWPAGSVTSLATLTTQLPADVAGVPQNAAAGVGVADGDGEGLGEDDGLGLGLGVGVGVTDGLGLGEGEPLGEGLGPG